MTHELFPRLSPPVQRPTLVQPWTMVDLRHGSGRELVDKLVRLMHGANVNDPAHIASDGAFLHARSHR